MYIYFRVKESSAILETSDQGLTVKLALSICINFETKNNFKAKIYSPF